MIFRWFSTSSLTVPKATVTIGVTVALTSYNFCTCNLKSWYLVIFFSSFTLMFWSPGTVLSMILHSLFSLSMTTHYLVFGVLFLYLFGLQSPKVFYICHFPALALVDPRTICLHTQSQISCTGASVLFSKFVMSLSVLVFQLGQNMNWQCGWHSQLSLCRACIAGTRAGGQCHFLLHLF